MKANNKIHATIILTVLIISTLYISTNTTGVEIEEDIAITRHNLSASSNANVKAKIPELGGTEELCVFCHTPHAATDDGPLWNRNLSTKIYNMYDSNKSKSFEANLVQTAQSTPTPTGYSKLCLSCHDGSIALGNVVNKPGSGGYDRDRQSFDFIQMINTETDGTIPKGSSSSLDKESGDTRRLGTNLTNDHPISFIMNDELIDKDGELSIPDPDDFSLYTKWSAYSGVKRYPRDFNQPTKDAVQCTSCHNPHSVTYPKFLRSPRFNNQTEIFKLTPAGDDRTAPAGEIICLTCHSKDDHGWTGSAHDKSPAIHKAYPTTANPYDFNGTNTVGEYACNNCHDTHTVTGANRLHREGVDSNGKESTENTCFLCHSPTGTSSDLNGLALIAGANTGFAAAGNKNVAPDIFTQFKKDGSNGGKGSAMHIDPATAQKLSNGTVTVGAGHEPVFIKRPAEGVELRSDSVIDGNKFNTNPDTVHIECTDCHNPHQVTGTNFPDTVTSKPNRLKGMKGITINGKVVGKEGQDIASTQIREPLVYEVCFRCHGNSYTNIFPKGSRFPDDITTIPRPNNFPPIVDPTLNVVSQSIRSDPSYGRLFNSFSYKGYSNKRLEFSPYDGGTQVDGKTFPRVIFGDNAGVDPLRGPEYYSTQSGQPIYKAFHPVAVRGRNDGKIDYYSGGVLYENSTNMLNLQLLGGLSSNSTITCTDCHNTDSIGDIKGAVTISTPTTEDSDLTNSGAYRNDDDPFAGNTLLSIENDPAKAIGPHGSQNIRVLRGNYYTDVQNWAGHNHDWVQTEFELCFRCHDYQNFVALEGEVANTNFRGVINGIDLIWLGNLHTWHIVVGNAHCHDCHMNIHSNAQAENTIYGKDPENPALGGEAPPDGNTHLINFNPASVSGYKSRKPRWYFEKINGNSAYRCSLRCHNRTMNECSYGMLSGATGFNLCSFLPPG